MAPENLKPEMRKTTLGEIAGMGLLTPAGDPVRAVDASKQCWVVYPASAEDEARVYLNEGDALADFDAISIQESGSGGE
ncbi:hypothetical protein FJV76_14205 [Mesorhizobium sp. WSM4303]|uniref:hypothetical protein n=1 Tax=Mesorhizobium sp. WSM4303 TaxID=2589887 RepID=UPI00115EAE75|nr:hypothetical protein [Mesorhizobium sp. WSM4303]TRD03786.1 hypothetical protein FJV76_14205 [Mesorhizobium sp. WSM4303]